jgi:uncharacterized membrane protein YccC
MESELSAAQGAAHDAAERLRAARDRHVAERERHEEAERAMRRARDELDAAEAATRRHAERMGRAEAELDGLAAPTGGESPGPAESSSDLGRLE